jgi:LuxR family transcriptional regulator, maltose regulon positive regulatory protein
MPSQVTGWMLSAHAGAGRPAKPALLDDERANSGEIRNPCAVICLAEGDPAGALGAVQHVLDSTAPVIGYVAVVEAHLCWLGSSSPPRPLRAPPAHSGPQITRIM